MSFADEVRTVLLDLVDVLETHGIQYLTMGGVAVPIWGIPRATYDVDVTLSADDEGFERFLRLVKENGFEVDEPFEKGFRDVLAGMQKIRMIRQESAFSRRVRARIDGREMWVLGPADLILHKLVAARPKNLADVQSVLAIQGLSDGDYLRSWARRLGVEERLRIALAEARLS